MYHLFLSILVTSLLRVAICFTVRSVLLYICLVKSGFTGSFPPIIVAALLQDVGMWLTGGLVDYFLFRFASLTKDFWKEYEKHNKDDAGPTTLMESAVHSTFKFFAQWFDFKQWV